MPFLKRIGNKTKSTDKTNIVLGAFTPESLSPLEKNQILLSNLGAYAPESSWNHIKIRNMGAYAPESV